MTTEPPDDEITPTVPEVAAVLRSRTQDSNMREVGNFTEDTRPTAVQVLDLIDTAVADVSVVAGPDAPIDLAASRKSAATIRTAMLIELSYFPEQVRSDRSPYRYYAELYAEQTKALRSAVSGTADGAGGDSALGSWRIPVYGEEVGIPGDGVALIPVISALEPSEATAGDPDVTLRVLGLNFDPSSVIVFNGGAETTVYVSASELTTLVKVSGDEFAPVPGTYTVQVRTGGYDTPALDFTIAPSAVALAVAAPAERA